MKDIDSHEKRIKPLKGFWIKSYSSILEDVTIATLPYNLWRRYQELNLVLAHDAKSGELPEVKSIAFRLRLPESQLSKEIEELASLGLINNNAGRYSLPNFVEEQGADTAAERKQKQREREALSQPYHDVVTNRDTERKRDKKEKIEQSREEEFSPAAAILGDEENEPDEAFWTRMKDLRPDLSIPRQIEAMKRHLHKKGDTRGISRRFAETWIMRESAPVRLPGKVSAKSNPSPQINEQAALAWLKEEYAGTQIEGTPVSEYREPFNKWNKFAQEAYQKTLRGNDAV